MPGPAFKAPELPWWADPEGESVLDPLHRTLVRKVVKLSGLDTPEGQVMSAAMPTPLSVAGPGIFGGLLAKKMRSRIPPYTPGASPAAADLITHLFGFKANMDPETIAKKAVEMSRVTPRKGFPSEGVRVPKRLTIRNQESTLSTPPKTEVWRRYAPWRDTSSPASVTSPDELPDIKGTALNMKQRTSRTKPPISGVQNAPNALQAHFKKSQFTEDDIRLIRNTTLEKAQKLYPKAKRETLRGIHNRDSWGWVKD